MDRRDGPRVRLDPERFEWEDCVLEALEHSTLPWFGHPEMAPELEVVPLDSREWSDRDARSLLAQYAAHQSFLNFAGLAEDRFDAGQWQVESARDRDIRLIRGAARRDQRADPEHPVSPSTSTAELAEWLGVDDIRALEEPWSRPDETYFEIVTSPIAQRGDWSWVWRARLGCELVREEEWRQITSSGASVPEARLDDVVAVARRSPASLLLEVATTGSSPLVEGSGIRQLTETLELDAASSGADEIRDALERLVVVPLLLIRSMSVLDRLSRRVVERLLDSKSVRLLIPETVPETETRGRLAELAPRAAVMLVTRSHQSSRNESDLLSALALPDRIEWAESSDPASSSRERIRSVGSNGGWPITEPVKSALAAIAVAGRTIARGTGEALIRELDVSIELDGLEGVTLLDGEISIRPDLRSWLLSEIPDGARETIVDRVVAVLVRRNQIAPALHALIEWNRIRDALELIERTGEVPDGVDLSSIEMTALLDEFPRAGEVLARALLSAGKYRSAMEMARAGKNPMRVIEAEAGRRRGFYEDALGSLEGVDGLEAAFLRTELYRLTGQLELATRELEVASSLARSESEAALVGWHSSLLNLEAPSRIADESGRALLETTHPWLACRLHAYDAMSLGDYESATKAAEEALEQAPDLPSKIEAGLDLQDVAYLAGDWIRAREIARDNLTLVEKTEGDRVQGGVLFLLAYLSADEGRFEEAERFAAQLRAYYRARGDRSREAEIGLIDAQIALARLDLATAADRASRLVAALNADIATAAELVVGEVDWMEGKEPASIGKRIVSHQLQARAALQTTRAGEEPPSDDSFTSQLARWERALLSGARNDSAPTPANRRERLGLLRSVIGVRRRQDSEELLSLEKELREETGLIREDPDTSLAELAALRAAADIAHHPDEMKPLEGRDWVVGWENRLGRWVQEGTIEKDRTELRGSEMIELDGRVVWIERSENFSREGRAAIAKLLMIGVRSLERERMEALARDRSEISVEPLDGLVGTSPGMLAIAETIARIAGSELPVLILGESGTGKELAARAVHARSRRSRGPFVAVNCSAIPQELAESELFGSVRGAFTGASTDRHGLVAAAAGGTLFLDEIGETPLLLQAKLLRFLQEGEFRRVGSTEISHADVRIVAATNRPLEKMIDEGRFREDLYYRIRGAELELPPLRERGDDVIALAQSFLEDGGRDGAETPKRFSSAALETLRRHSWPGNVRELQAVVRTAQVLAGDAEVIDIEHLDDRLDKDLEPARPTKGGYHAAIDSLRRELIANALRRSGGNQAAAARELGLTRQALSYQVRQLGIRVKNRGVGPKK